MMQALERAAAVFCTGCICAELLTRLVGPGWGQRCIKGVAGLYILVVLAGLLTGAGTGLGALAPAPAEAASLGSLEQTILAQAEAQLASRLEQQCLQHTGRAATLGITLCQTAEGVTATQAVVTPESRLEGEAMEAVEGFLCSQLGLQPQQILWAAPGGEEAP